jgi:hypothetical protein
MPIACVLVALALTRPEGVFAATPHSEPPPVELATPVRELMAAGGTRATARGAALRFWWVAALPIKGDGRASWADVQEGALVGAVSISADFRDIRGRIVKPGVYTLRYGIQPENGDHLGTSPYREFLLLSPSALDTSAAARGHDGTIELSKRTVGGSHPAPWSLDPPVTTDPLLSEHENPDLELRALVMEVPVARGGTPAGALRFALVLAGKIEA